jgi:hypothetical protein
MTSRSGNATRPGLTVRRREFLFGSAVVLGSLSTRGRHAAATALEVQSPQGRLRTLIRLQGSLEEVDCPWWYSGTIYGVTPDAPMRPLVRFEGLEIARFRRIDADRFRLTGRTTSFMKNLAGEPAGSMVNPYTGRPITPVTNRLGGRGYMLYSVEGLQAAWGGAEPSAPLPIQLGLQAFGEEIWISTDRIFPRGMPQPTGEASVMRVRRADLEGDAPAVSASFSSTNIAPWPRWMEMQDHPGHVFWHADGLKLASIEQLPPAFLERMRREHPDQLQAPRE